MPDWNRHPHESGNARVALHSRDPRVRVPRVADSVAIIIGAMVIAPHATTTGMRASDDVVFLLDVDNTLLDNDCVQADLFNHLASEFGAR